MSNPRDTRTYQPRPQQGVILYPNPDLEQELIEYVSHFPPELNDQIRYIMYYDRRYNGDEAISLTQVALKMNMGRTSLWLTVKHWKEDGSLDKAMDMLEAHSRDQLAIALLHAHASLPRIIDNIRRMAEEGTGKNALDAAKVMLDLAKMDVRKRKPTEEDDLYNVADYLKRHETPGS